VRRGRQDPIVRLTFFRGQFLTIPQGDRHTGGVHEQVVFGREASEEQAMPALASHLLDQGLEAIGVQVIPQLAGAGTLSVAQAALVLVEGGEGAFAIDGHGQQRGLRRGFGSLAGVEDGSL